MPSFVLNDRYELTGVLGSGAQGQVHRALDRVRGEVVAIKRLGASGVRDPSSVFALRAEFRRLSTLSHPNLVAVLDLDTAQGDLDVDPPIARGDLFFSATLIDGVGLEPWCSASARGPLDVLDCIESLAGALAHAHHHGVLHCDIKPSNIIVSENRGPVLIDFGLSVRRGDSGLARGTLAYMEEHALAGEPDAESDLHALGATLYRALTGAAPFAHESPSTLAGSLATPPRIARLRADLAGPVADIIDVLIDRRQRPRSASALLDRVWSAREALGGAARPAAVHERGGGGVVRLIGRDAIVNEACQAVRLVGTAAPALIAVIAEPGVGCGAVLEEVARRSQIAAIGSGGSLEVLRGDSGRVVEQLVGVKADSLEALSGRARVVASADAAIAGLARRASERPVLWLVDHDTAIDERAREVMAALAAGHRGLEGAAATVIARAPAAFEDSDAVTTLELAPLTPDDIALLATAILGEIPDRGWLAELAGLCLGKPRLLTDGLADAANRREPLAEIDPRELVSRDAATSALAYLAGRLTGLGSSELDVLACVAVAAPLCTPAWISEVTGEAGDVVFAALTELERRDWIRKSGELAMTSDAHARAVEERIATKRRRELHRAALELAASSGALDPARRARHLDVLGPAKDALSARRDAAAYHFERGELERASALIEAVLDGADGAELSSAAVLSARIELERGDYERAIRSAQRAARSRDAGRQRDGTLLGAQARQRSGDLAGAEKDLQALLARNPDDQAARGALAKILLLLGRYQEAATCAGALEVLGASADGDGLELCLEAAGLAALYQGDKPSARAAFERLRKLAIVRDAEPLAGRASALLGLAAHHSGDVVAASEHYRQAARTARASGQIHAAASAEINRGAAEADRGRFVAALGALDAALVLLRRLGNTAELPAALYNRAHCLFALGDMSAAEATARRALEHARDGGRAQFELYAQLLLGDIARRGGDPERAAALYEEARAIADRAGAVLDVSALELNVAELLAEQGNDAATEHLERARAAGGGDRERLLLSSARVSLALESAVPGLSDELEQAAERARERGREDLYWRLSALAARLAAASGSRDRARLNATAALAELGRTLAAVPPERHLPMRRDPDVIALDALDAELELSGLRAPHPTDHGETDSTAALRRLLGLSSRLNSELRLDALLDQVIDAAIELAGAERGFLLLRRAGALDVAVARNIDQRALSADGDVAVSRSIAERAAESGEIVLALDAAFDERFGAAESVAAMRLRSVLAVPLRFRRELIGTIYVDHRFRAAAFGERAVQMIRELANIAGVAIGNARIAEESRARAAEIDALNRTLEEELGEREAEIATIKSQLPASVKTNAAHEIIGSSAAIRELHQLLERMARAALPVVVTGESGSGKELVARALHRLSPRRAGPFVAVNCGAVAETLLESELFGHVRGAFTGAERTRRGHFEVADGGTLFLDEIADTSPAMQAKLLRVLQEGELRRLGDEELRRVDVRVVAATNQDLRTLADAGTFREDLFFRLNVLSIQVPPLRARAGDIAELAEHLLERMSRGAAPTTLSGDAVAVLSRYAWPGNVRELENELARASALADGHITREHLSPHIAGAAGDSAREDSLDLKERVEELERELIDKALEETDGNQTRAAKILGLSRYGLQKKLKRYG